MKRIPLVQALSWIVGVTLVFSVTAHKALRYSFSQKSAPPQKEKITYLMQTGPSREVLHSDYLMELLELSSNQEILFSSFDVKKAKKQILASPVIREAEVKKIAPDTVYVDYAVRKPVAWIADFYNIALDREGILFPIHPFFSPKKLPEIYLGKGGCEMSKELGIGKPLEGKYIELALSLLDILSERGKDLFFVKRIDVSQMEAATLGKRELILVLDQEFPTFSTHYLRLSVRNFMQEIANYMQLREFLLSAEQQGKNKEEGNSCKIKVIDLRLDQLAYIH